MDKLESIVKTMKQTFNVRCVDLLMLQEQLTLVFESPEFRILVEVDFKMNITGVDFRQSDIRKFEAFYF